MATENELVYVPQQAVEPWYKHSNFWMGVGSSLLATMIFWYLLRDMQSDASQDGESDQGPKNNESLDIV